MESNLIHWDWDEIGTILQITFSNAFSWKNALIAIKIIKFIPRGRINNFLTLVQIMAWRRLGDKPLSEVGEWLSSTAVLGTADSGHRGPFCPYKPCNHSLYIGIIIFPHIDYLQATINFKKKAIKDKRKNMKATR